MAVVAFHLFAFAAASPQFLGKIIVAISRALVFFIPVSRRCGSD